MDGAHFYSTFLRFNWHLFAGLKVKLWIFINIMADCLEKFIVHDIALYLRGLFKMFGKEGT